MSNQPTTTTSHNGEDGKPMKTEGVERASLTDAEADALTAIAHIAVTTVPELQVRRGEANALLNYMSRLERERSELRTALTASESLLALTNEALAACQAQAAGKIRELEARLRAARYDDEVDDGDMSDDEQDGFCDCGALHSEGTEESDGGQCSACGGAI